MLLVALSLAATMAGAVIMRPMSALRSQPAATQRSSVAMYESYSAAFGRAQADVNVWYIFPRDPGGSLYNDYMVPLGGEQVLGRYDLMDPANPLGANQPLRPDQDSVAVEQCAVQIAQDGSHAVMYALGHAPTGYRSGPDVPWTWINPGESVQMGHYWKISMDCNYPDEAVYKLGDGYCLQQEEAEMAATEQGGAYAQPGTYY